MRTDLRPFGPSVWSLSLVPMRAFGLVHTISGCPYGGPGEEEIAGWERSR
jgi:hypothetical protein